MEDARSVLAKVARELSRRGINASGPYPGREAGRDYLAMDDGKYMHAEQDGDGRWYALIHAGSRTKGTRRVPVANMVDLDAEELPSDQATY